ncbi:rRNA-processing protein LAS1 [Spizellomyces punctatus DAOM BR117]|uniref:Las1-domain-containing protein n=1 Tax=Spizellomyces punctatus (strain DAOM BR117) TaxID=645134 RepID=A0A0L0H8M4_SPIPD|nr:rRNA-processing protein LAS1 [Spizellomyces punctatus DAOM BR117]KNC97331.1 hypothetical protein, variant [Spizellomyces punctatus DAOM BR117]|eukprot:XP_016605371.1 hypothetical protein, variant [Spizellomyces punctatus DAOM BR117]
MPARHLRSVPWAKQEEWEEVYSWLYASDVHLREKGVKRVKAWASRGKLPHSVDSTATLVEVWLRDGCERPVSEHEVRLMYTMAFIRFVNGVVDANQRGMYATSVANIAEELGLPGWFVDLRHAGTHDQLPSLALLRSGCEQALQWLHTNYWSLQKAYLADTLSEVRTLLTTYKKKKRALLDKETEPILNEIVALTTTDNYADVLIPTLLEEGLLVPKSQKKRATFNEMKVPDGFLELWKGPLIRFENAWPGFAEELFLHIVDILTGSDTVQPSTKSTHQVLAAWAHYVLRHFLLVQASGWDNALEACLKRHHIYTRAMVGCFAEAVPSLREKLSPFITYMDATAAEPKRRDAQATMDSSLVEQLEVLRGRVEAFKNAADLHVTSKGTSLPGSDAEINDERGWVLYPSKEWRPCPIGCLPGGVLPSLELPDWFDDEEYVVNAGIVQIPAYMPANMEEAAEGGTQTTSILEEEIGEPESDEMDLDMQPDPAPAEIVDIAAISRKVVLL